MLKHAARAPGITSSRKVTTTGLVVPHGYGPLCGSRRPRAQLSPTGPVVRCAWENHRNQPVDIAVSRTTTRHRTPGEHHDSFRRTRRPPTTSTATRTNTTTRATTTKGPPTDHHDTRRPPKHRQETSRRPPKDPTAGSRSSAKVSSPKCSRIAEARDLYLCCPLSRGTPEIVSPGYCCDFREQNKKSSIHLSEFTPDRSRPGARPRGSSVNNGTAKSMNPPEREKNAHAASLLFKV